MAANYMERQRYDKGNVYPADTDKENFEPVTYSNIFLLIFYSRSESTTDAMRSTGEWVPLLDTADELITR